MKKIYESVILFKNLKLLFEIVYQIPFYFQKKRLLSKKTRARLEGKRRNLLSSFQHRCQGKRTKKKKFTFKNVYQTSLWTLFMGLCWAFGFLIKNNIITIVGRFFFFFFPNLFVFLNLFIICFETCPFIGIVVLLPNLFLK